MWMSDRPRTQQRLAIDLSDLVAACHSDNKLAFLRAFWVTMAREWTKIDVLRMDKFLLLVRRYLAATFSHLASTKWDEQQVAEHMLIIHETPLAPRDSKISNGLRYHVLDIYVDELDKSDDREHGEIPLELLLGPLRKLKENSPVKVVRKRAADALEDVRLSDWQRLEPSEAEGKTGDEESAEEED